MEISENARLYAIEALESEIDKLAMAYDAGYKQAYKEIGTPPVDINGIKYYDLGLPSGTLWSQIIYDSEKSPLKLPFKKANVLNLPTKAQVDELLSNSQISYKNSKWHCLGISGESLTVYSNRSFWIKDSIDENNEAESFTIRQKNNFDKCFVGMNNYILLVKTDIDAK